MLAARLLVLLCTCVLSVVGGGPMCSASGVWTEASVEQLESGVAPHVQCWRRPPCVRWSYATPDRCKAMPRDEDWPRDPHIESSPAGAPLKELLETVLANKSVVFVGDSINNLIFRASLCEAAKEFATVVDLKAFHSVTDSETRQEMASKLKHFHSTVLELMEKHDLSTGPLWLGGQPSDAHYVAETRTTIFVKGWHKWQRSDMAGVMALADVVVVNYALHYAGNTSEYEEHMPQMFQQLSEWVTANPGKLALFRETGADHANVKEGEPGYSFTEDEVGHPSADVVKGCHCQQRPAEEQARHSAPLMNSFIKGLLPRFPHIGYIPFYDLTLPRHDSHEAGYCAFDVLRDQKRDPSRAKEGPPYCCDCTHYCYTPPLWKTFFKGMGDAVRQVAGRE